MKRLVKTMVFATILAVAAIVNSCEMEEFSEKNAKNASNETCDCLKKHSLKYCEDELNKKYFVDEAFIKAFNKANDCGVTLTKK
jgi:ABC-type transporter MlaC component